MNGLDEKLRNHDDDYHFEAEANSFYFSFFLEFVVSFHLHRYDKTELPESVPVYYTIASSLFNSNLFLLFSQLLLLLLLLLRLVFDFYSSHGDQLVNKTVWNAIIHF
jgi:hypothetical protein